MRNIYVAFVFLAFCSVLVAQQALSNDSVIKLVKAGMSDDLIISTINASPGIFDTSVDGIIALKAQGASDKVVSAILSKGAVALVVAAPRAPARPQATPDPNDPMSPHEPGIYMMTTNADGNRTMVLLTQPNVQFKHGNQVGNALSLGYSGRRWDADLPGTRAALRTSEKKPEFYIYFEPAGTIGFAGGTENPREEFSLRMLEVEKDHRITTVAKFKVFLDGNYEKPKPDKWTIGFTSEAIRAHAFRVTLNAQLKPGEYAFTEEQSRVTGSTTYTPGVGEVRTQTRAKVFHFGVD